MRGKSQPLSRKELPGRVKHRGRGPGLRARRPGSDVALSPAGSGNPEGTHSLSSLSVFICVMKFKINDLENPIWLSNLILTLTK